MSTNITHAVNDRSSKDEVPFLTAHRRELVNELLTAEEKKLAKAIRFELETFRTRKKREPTREETQEIEGRHTQISAQKDLAAMFTVFNYKAQTGNQNLAEQLWGLAMSDLAGIIEREEAGNKMASDGLDRKFIYGVSGNFRANSERDTQSFEKNYRTINPKYIGDKLRKLFGGKTSRENLVDSAKAPTLSEAPVRQKAIHDLYQTAKAIFGIYNSMYHHPQWEYIRGYAMLLGQSWQEAQKALSTDQSARFEALMTELAPQELMKVAVAAQRSAIKAVFHSTQ